MNVFQWLTAVASIVGVILNIRGNRWCFLIWTPCNAAWCVIDLLAGVYAQALVQGIYFCLGIWGFRRWRSGGR